MINKKEEKEDKKEYINEDGKIDIEVVYIDEELENELTELMQQFGEDEEDVFKDMQKSKLVKTVITMTWLKYKKTILFTIFIFIVLLFLFGLEII